MSRKTKRRRFRIREDKKERIEVHVAGFCFRNDRGKLQLLVGRRQKARELFPDLWECGGGQVNSGENFKEALQRQYFEEFGIEIKILWPMLTYEIRRPAGPKIPGLKFLCVSADNGREKIILNRREFSETQWVNESQCKSLNMIPGVQKQAKDAFQLAKQYFGIGSKTKPKPRIGFVINPPKSS